MCENRRALVVLLVLLLAATPLAVLACGSSSPISGKYVHADETMGLDETLEVTSDSTYVIKDEYFGQPVAMGSYYVEGDTITFKSMGDYYMSATLEGQDLVDEYGNRWVKQ